MKNKERFINYAQRHNIAVAEETLDRRLEIVPAFSRKVIETRWGLNGRCYCKNFDILEKELGLKDSRELYDKSMRDLEYAVYAEIVTDRNKIGDWNVTVGLGKLACVVVGSKDADMVVGEKLFEALDKLTPREKNVIFLRFGLDGKGTRTIQEVCEIFEITRERVRQIESKAIRKLRHVSYLKIFYIPNIRKEEKSVEEREIEYTDLFTVRTVNVLKRANFNTIEDILNNPHKLLTAGNFGKKTAQEILEFLESSELASEECNTTKEFLKDFIRQKEAKQQ